MKRAHPRSIIQAQEIARTYNLIASSRGEARMDADETNMLALQLEQMRMRVYETEYPELKSRRFISVDNEVDSGADSHSFEETDYVGKAKVIRNYADDPETVESSGTKRSHQIVALGDSYYYTLQDIRRASFSGKPLSARKALAARRIWERGLDEVAALGAPDDGIPDGLLNKTVGTGSTQIRGTAVTSANWLDASLDADGMISDINLAVQEMVEDSKELYTPNILLLPTSAFLRLSQTRMSADNSETALEGLLRANPWLESVESWDLLRTIDGTSGNNARGLLMRRDPEVAELVIPQEFEVLPPQPKNYAFKVLCHGRTGGTVVHRPLGMRYLTALPCDPSP